MGQDTKSKRPVFSFPENLIALVIDEHELIRKLAIKALKRIGFKSVIEISNGMDAKQYITKGKFDLIVSNVDLPDYSGYQLLQTLRSLESRSDIPFLFLTGRVSKDDIIKAADHGADDYIVLPFQSEDLEIKASKILQHYFNPSPQLAQIRSAETFLRNGDFLAALDLTRKVLETKQSPRATHLLAYIHFCQGNMSDAKHQLIENVKKFPDYLKNYISLANIYIHEKQNTKAIEALSEELQRHPKQPDRQALLGSLFSHELMYEKAIQHFRLALLESPKLPEALHGMGLALAHLGRIDKALYYLKRYRKNHPKDSKSLRTILRLTEASNLRKLGENTLKDEIKANPDRFDAYYILSEHFVKLKEFDKAKEILEDLCQKTSSHVQAVSLLAKIYILQKQPDKAAQIHEALCHELNSADASIGLATTYLLIGRLPQCIATLNQAIQQGASLKQTLPLMIQATFRTKQHCKSFILTLLLSQQEPQISTTQQQKVASLWLNKRQFRKKSLTAS